MTASKSISPHRSRRSVAEIVRAADPRADAFYRSHEREALKSCWAFTVVWHEQSVDLLALDGEIVVGTARLRIAASLGHVERIVVDPEHRRRGIGRALLLELDAIANYYNCHKMTIGVLHNGEAQRFFEACGYHEEGVLLQHDFKLDVAMLRKFLL